ncbi:MAG: AAA family ATPase [Butyrivibrio sp.]|nr:AAA family ATPase [Butyrivibrio sp.]
MRLISCHIENFGKLSDFTLSFDSDNGIKVICENNGWGKSTLATYIKVMFYGFDNEGRRSEVENERQHYRPWQGGVYGGQLTFEAGGRTYIMSRTFGSKEKNDEFMLRNADTMLESTDFSSNIGEELFQIDRASFMRSIFISQNDCVTATTDAINAKLGNLTDNTNDLNNYESADKKIGDMLNSLSATRKTGIMYKQKEKIAALKQEIKSGEGIDASMEEIMRMKGGLHSAYADLKEEQGALQKKQKAISEYKDIAVRKKEYEHLCKAEEQKQKELAEKKTFFAGGLPGEDELGEYIKLENSTAGLKKELDIYSLTDDEKRELEQYSGRFADGVPHEEDIEEQNKQIGVLQNLWRNIEKAILTDEERNSLKSFEEIHKDGVPSKDTVDRLINLWRQRNEKKNMLSAKTAAAEMLELADKAKKENEAARKQEELENARRESERIESARKEKDKRRKKFTLVLLTAALLMIIVAALVAAASGVPLESVLPLMGAALAVVGLALLFTGRRRITRHSDMDYSDAEYNNARRSDLELDDIRHSYIEYSDTEHVETEYSDTDRADAVTSADTAFSDADSSEPYLAMRNAIADDEKFISDAENEIRQFCEKYGIEYDELNVADNLYRFGEDIRQYETIRKKSQNIETENMLRQYDEICGSIKSFLYRYGFDADSDSMRTTGDIFMPQPTTDTVSGAADAQNPTGDTIPRCINALHKLENAAADYKRIKEKHGKYEAAHGEYIRNTGRIKDFLRGLEMEPEQDMRAQLQNISTALREYGSTLREYNRAAELKKKFEENSADIDKLKETEIVEQEEASSLTEIEERLSAISEELEKNHNGILSYERRLEELQEKRDGIADLERELEELLEQYAANEKKLNILKKTKIYLEQAKISLTARYTKPIKDGFDKYFNILSGIEALNYQLDANLDMSVMEQGMPRKTDFLSTGYKDMVGICLRMALIDAMYEGEKPFVIFDDPFVNLDDDKIKGAIKLLDAIAKEYQLVYFTCHGNL